MCLKRLEAEGEDDDDDDDDDGYLQAFALTPGDDWLRSRRVYKI